MYNISRTLHTLKNYSHKKLLIIQSIYCEVSITKYKFIADFSLSLDKLQYL